MSAPLSFSAAATLAKRDPATLAPRESRAFAYLCTRLARTRALTATEIAATLQATDLELRRVEAEVRRAWA